MRQPARTCVVQPDDFLVSNQGHCLEGRLQEALAVCVHDASRSLGGLLHLRLDVCSLPGDLEPTDNTLSSNLLLLETFCRQLQSLGSRRAQWQIRMFCHSQAVSRATATATVLDLVQAYFMPAPRPVECRRMNHPQGAQVRLLAATGQLWVQALGDRGGAAQLRECGGAP